MLRFSPGDRHSNEVRHVRIKLALFLALVFVCSCSCAFANATYTDQFDSSTVTHCCSVSPFGGPPPIPLVQYDVSALEGGRSFASYTYPDVLQVWMPLKFSALVSSFTEIIDCTAVFPFCRYQWSGTFNGGNMPITASIYRPPDNINLNF